MYEWKHKPPAAAQTALVNPQLPKQSTQALQKTGVYLIITHQQYEQIKKVSVLVVINKLPGVKRLMLIHLIKT